MSKKESKLGTNYWAKGQRIVSDKYREGYDQIAWDKDYTVDESIPFPKPERALKVNRKKIIR